MPAMSRIDDFVGKERFLGRFFKCGLLCTYFTGAYKDFSFFIPLKMAEPRKKGMNKKVIANNTLESAKF